MAAHPAAVPMFQACIKYGLPKSFHRDFITHDMNDLDQLTTASTHQPFLWILRENGTHFFSGPIPQKITTLFAYEERHFFTWINGDLTEHGPEQAYRLFTQALQGGK